MRIAALHDIYRNLPALEAVLHVIRQSERIRVKDGDGYVSADARSPFFHAPCLRGLDVIEAGMLYGAVTGCRCVVKFSADGKVETILKAERPWAPTGVASRNGDAYVLGYTNANDSPDTGWRPRVRKIGRDGKVTIVAEPKP